MPRRRWRSRISRLLRSMAERFDPAPGPAPVGAGFDLTGAPPVWAERVRAAAAARGGLVVTGTGPRADDPPPPEAGVAVPPADLPVSAPPVRPAPRLPARPGLRRHVIAATVPEEVATSTSRAPVPDPGATTAPGRSETIVTLDSTSTQPARSAGRPGSHRASRSSHQVSPDPFGLALPTPATGQNRPVTAEPAHQPSPKPDLRTPPRLRDDDTDGPPHPVPLAGPTPNTVADTAQRRSPALAPHPPAPHTPALDSPALDGRTLPAVVQAPQRPTGHPTHSPPREARTPKVGEGTGTRPRDTRTPPVIEGKGAPPTITPSPSPAPAVPADALWPELPVRPPVAALPQPPVELTLARLTRLAAEQAAT